MLSNTSILSLALRARPTAGTAHKALGLLLTSLMLAACAGGQTSLPTEPRNPTVPPVQIQTPVATTQPLVIEEIIVSHEAGNGANARQQRLDSSQLIGGSHPSRIALLLPLTSSLGQAAEAFQSGFMDAYHASSSLSSIQIYDTGSEHDLAALYYLSAINDGNQFVVGPLGKRAVDALLMQQELNTPTLLIGQVPDDRLVANAWGISLSPEDEARATAQRALSQNRSHAAILYRDNDWGQRVMQAFQETFEAEGGRVVSVSPYQPGAADSSVAIKRLLALSESEARHREMTALLGRKLKFSSRRRTDLDFVFFVGNSKEARRVVPQLKFFRAHDVPVYATSAVFGGKANPVSDADLAGLSFPDIPWMLTGLAGHKAATAASATTGNNLSFDTFQPPVGAADEPSMPSLRAASRQLPYGGSPLDRLYALGQTAFGVIPEIASLTADPSLRYSSDSMTVRVADAGNLLREFTWAQYTAKGIKVESSPVSRFESMRSLETIPTIGQ